MSRTTLCVLTALALAGLSVGTMVVRHRVLGDEVKRPGGPGAWKVTLEVRGHAQGGARLLTATPPDVGRQHVWRETYRSDELLDKPLAPRVPHRRQVHWSPRPGAADAPFRARCEFYCDVAAPRPTAAAAAATRAAYAAPAPGEWLDAESKAGTDAQQVSAAARRLTAGLERQADQAEALYEFVAHELRNQPSVGGPETPLPECLASGGDARAKARLLAALLRNRGVAARLVTGLALSKGYQQLPHYWVEAWVEERWLPLDPFYQHFGRVPSTFLLFGIGDVAVVRGRNVRDLDFAFLVERTAAEEAAADDLPWRRRLSGLSLYTLPAPEQRLVEFLLMLPAAALIVCVFRNLIGLHSFGTFAPALVGLAFRDLRSLPGIFVFVSLVLVGWLLRRALDRYHLLQVPRVAVLLTLVVGLLIAAVVAANALRLAATAYISLFPMVILTGMIERFWTLETEDGTASSFKTLLSTVLIAAVIAVVLSLQAVAQHLFRYPETLGLVLAAQLLIGRYTGYRLMELYRFRDFIGPEWPAGCARGLRARIHTD